MWFASTLKSYRRRETAENTASVAQIFDPLLAERIRRGHVAETFELQSKPRC